jgi:hypothetical protein
MIAAFPVFAPNSAAETPPSNYWSANQLRVDAAAVSKYAVDEENAISEIGHQGESLIELNYSEIHLTQLILEIKDFPIGAPQGVLGPLQSARDDDESAITFLRTAYANNEDTSPAKADIERAIALKRSVATTLLNLANAMTTTATTAPSTTTTKPLGTGGTTTSTNPASYWDEYQLTNAAVVINGNGKYWENEALRVLENITDPSDLDVIGIKSDLSTSEIYLQRVIDELAADPNGAPAGVIELLRSAIDYDHYAGSALKNYKDRATARKDIVHALSLKEAAYLIFKSAANTAKEAPSTTTTTKTTKSTSVSVSQTLAPSGKQDITLLSYATQAVSGTLSSPTILPPTSLPSDIRAVAGTDKNVDNGTSITITIPIVINDLGSTGGTTSPGALDFKVSVDGYRPDSVSATQIGAPEHGTVTADDKSVSISNMPVNKTICATVRSDLLGEQTSVALQSKSLQPSSNSDVNANTFNALCGTLVAPLKSTESTTTTSSPSTTTTTTTATHPTTTSTSPSGAKSSYTCSGSSVKLFDNFNTAAIQNGSTSPFFGKSSLSPTIDIGSTPYCLWEIFTDQYNNGKGDASAGSLTLVPTGANAGQSGSLGPWSVTHQAANQDFVVIRPTNANPTVIVGNYRLTDSAPNTWAVNAQSANKGFVEIWGFAATKVSGSSTSSSAKATVAQWVKDLKAIIAQQSTAKSDLASSGKTAVNLNDTATAIVALENSLNANSSLLQSNGNNRVAMTAALTKMDGDDYPAYLDAYEKKPSAAIGLLTDAAKQASTVLTLLETLQAKVS